MRRLLAPPESWSQVQPRSNWRRDYWDLTEASIDPQFWISPGNQVGDMSRVWVILFGLVSCPVWVAAQVPPATIYLSERRDVGSPGTADSLPRVLAIALPNSYRDSITKPYPVVYVLDGDGMFGVTSDIQRLLVIRHELPEAIVVGIGHGQPFLETVPFRWRNFTPTAVAEHPGTGHAADLLSYLSREVLPLVDSLYRTVRSDRTLVGMSRAGLFALYSLYQRSDLFARLVIASPEVTWDNRYLFRRDSAFAASPHTLRVTVYLSVGGAELAHPFGAAVMEFADTLRARKYRGLHLVAETLPGETHASMVGPAIAHGLKAVFADTLQLRAADSARP